VGSDNANGRKETELGKETEQVLTNGGVCGHLLAPCYSGSVVAEDGGNWVWWELRLTTTVPFRENDKGHNDTHKFQCINLEFVWMLLRESGPFPQTVGEGDDADDLNGGYTDPNSFLGRVRGRPKSRVP
jgi:hypothetical protein